MHKYTDARGVTGYGSVCALADKFLSMGLPMSVDDVQYLRRLAASVSGKDKNPQFKKPAPTLLTLKYRTNRKSSVIPGAYHHYLLQIDG